VSGDAAGNNYLFPAAYHDLHDTTYMGPKGKNQQKPIFYAYKKLDSREYQTHNITVAKKANYEIVEIIICKRQNTRVHGQAL
jgi:hypothetical protein